MPGKEKTIIFLSVFGTQEILIFICSLIPIAVIVWLIRIFYKIRKDTSRIADFRAANEIEKLFNLKEKGAITEQEFNDRKSKLLK